MIWGYNNSMIDINYIRENPEKIKEGIEAKQLDPKLVDEVLELDKKRRELLNETETLRADRNKAAKEQDKEKGGEIKTQLQKLEPKLSEIEKEYIEKLYQIPNPPADDVKTGKDESKNEVVRKWGEKKESPAKNYLELGENLDIIDIKRAAKVSGSRFGYLKGEAALLELALVQFAMEFLVKEGFTPIIPPSFIKKESMRGMGYLEHGGEEDMYVFEKDDLVLVGTSEQSIGPMHMNEVLEEKDLPKRYVSFSPCFRREAGSYGKDTKGILRVHQFDKVEMFSFTKPENSEKEHEYLLSLEEKLFQALEIPYQIVKMCSGDLGAPATKKYDLEAWMPGQGKYREVTSTSNTTDFQARRLNIKYQDKGEAKFVHTLNGTAFAIGRTIIAIIENYQEKNGSVKIPEVLQKWIGKDRIPTN